MQLGDAPFRAIRTGKKVIESRLFDEKRKLIQLGDTIVFTNREAPVQNVTVRVTGLFRYETFHELFARNDPTKFGGQNAAELERQINTMYPAGEQKAYGVIGIEFELL